MKIKLSILFLCLAMSIFSQEKVDISFINTPLLEVLKETETNYGVKFSFNTEIIKEETFSFSKKKCELIYLLTEIEHQTPLFFHKINDRYYYITKNANFKHDEYNLLNEIQVTNYITSGINKKKNGSISILPKEIGVLPGLTEPDVLESLKIIPGVLSPNETAADMYVRGGTPSQNLVLWDGIKMYYSGHFFGMISAFNPYTTKEVTLSKSGTEARYGDRVSGVIDIKSTENIPEKTTGTFGINMTHADAFINFPLSDKTALLLSARSSFSNILKTFTFNNISTRVFQTFNSNQESTIDNTEKFDRDNKFNFLDYSAKFIYKPSENEFLYISFINTKNKLYNNFNIPKLINNYHDKLNVKNTGLGINWEKKTKKNTTHKIKGYFSNFNLAYQAKYGFLANYILFNSTKDNYVKDFGISYNTQYAVNAKTNFLWGYDYSYTETNYALNFSYDIGESESLSTKKDIGISNTHSVFGEYIYYDNDWNINFGARFNYFSKINKLAVEPRFYFEKKVHKNLSLKASFEQKHQALSKIIEFQTFILGFDLDNQIWVQANNDDIPLQKSTQFSTGIFFNKNHWKIDVEPYFKKVKGITSQTSGYNDQTNDFSSGEGKVWGIDVLVNKRFNNYRTWINYSYTNNKFKFLDIENKYFPANHDITNYFSWSHAYKLNNYEFSLGWIYRTGTPYTKIKFQNNDNSSAEVYLDTENMNANRVPNYHRLDASMTYSFSFSEKWNGRLGFSVINIYNRKNVLSRNFKVIPVTNSDEEIEYQLEQVDKISLGITPNIVFRVSF